METDLLKVINGENIRRGHDADRIKKKQNIKRIIDQYNKMSLSDVLLGIANNMGDLKLIN